MSPAQLLSRQIGHDHAMHLALVEREGSRGDVCTSRFAASGADQPNVATLAEHAGGIPIRRVGHEVCQIAAAKLLHRHPHQAFESSVGVHDHACRRHGEGALVHLLHEQPVRRVGSLEAVHYGPGGTLHDDGVDLAGANGAQRVLSLGQLPAQSL